MQGNAGAGTTAVENQSASDSGPRYEMPDGSVYEVTLSAAASDGERTEMISTLPPGNVSPPPHVHPSQFNDFKVLDGTVELMVDGHWHTFTQGDNVTVPPGTLHTFRNRSSSPVRLLDIHRPAGRFEAYLAHINALLDARGITSGKDPRIPIYMSMLAREYSDTVLSTRLRDRMLLGALAGLGRILRMSTSVAA